MAIAILYRHAHDEIILIMLYNEDECIALLCQHVIPIGNEMYPPCIVRLAMHAEAGDLY